ncbi:MAG: glutamate formimidoyltransferase [Blastocatellia bacterium]|nr:glutamate formimidoyltransferase [Blastocatellia bacterium]MCS7157017.1 glutamate formimidoyltransferase [Blastocatellia bacterium]MCX7752218.1 glutamate formimidoyltransferase [Blastocatellia bacterium]MDW8167710.1 glutamate formimidoyltransferase [Acidobacteriota bacterium]MDW8256309.1 glutamate formimidoyltransferase [Acidobacteriota bacterium]
MKKIVECIPNFSEGRRLEVVDEIVRAIESVPGVLVLDREMDRDHNRSVITFVAEPEAAVEAAVRATRRAAELIDLNEHRGEHPRIGATDVIPFVPIRNVTMEECVALARETGRRIAEELNIPVYLYERAATRPDRVDLANIRKGEFEGLREAIARDPDRAPDFGPPRVHPTAGATVVGARPPLIAYNVNLNTNDIEIARKIARAVRGRDGGLRYVKALGFELRDRGIVQVSMNLVDYEQTPIFRAFEMVKREAERYGVSVRGSEIVGLVPQAALDACAEWYLQLENFSREQILENRLAAALAQAEAAASSAAPTFGVQPFLDAVAAATPAPGGGSAAALSGALAAALGEMMSRLTLQKPRFENVHERLRAVLAQLEDLRRTLSAAIEADAESFRRVMAAYRLPKETEEQQRLRHQEIQEALKAAVIVPARTAEAAHAVLRALLELAQIGSPNALSDVAVGAQLALAAIKGAYYNVLANLTAITDQAFNNEYHNRVLALLEEAEDWATHVETQLLNQFASASE